MPNLNVTDVRVAGSKDQIEQLYKIMTALEEAEKPAIENGFGTTWYGCLVNALGADWNNVYCRGSWQELEKVDNNTLRWWDETAWGPVLEVFDLIEAKFPELKVYWLAEEPGMCYFESNDCEHKFFNTQFILYYNDAYETEYFDSEEELLDFINELIDEYNKEGGNEHHVHSLQELDKLVEDVDNNGYSNGFCDLSYYKFNYRKDNNED